MGRGGGGAMALNLLHPKGPKIQNSKQNHRTHFRSTIFVCQPPGGPGRCCITPHWMLCWGSGSWGVSAPYLE